ncbi:unnamed protein product [Brachionus calyciflorus]|uniref:Endonuclease/exonuclease/phosphatase domain-containing protein n=1 Tax=Brachionus calyciflorus TaxID=104777 RepID=A0A814ME14_9BILA|nr:unnamed protein product [Brachionus calyciflorus]
MNKCEIRRNFELTKQDKLYESEIITLINLIFTPIFVTIGLFGNLYNILVLKMNLKISNEKGFIIPELMVLNPLVNFLYCFINLLHLMNICIGINGVYGPFISRSISVQIIEIYLIDYFGNVLKTLSNFLCVAILNVHLIYDNGTVENRISFASDMEILNVTLNELKTKGKEVIIIRDFNTDLSRKNRHTQMLLEFTSKNDLIFFDLVKEQIIKQTYNGMKNSSWIDHVLGESSNKSISDITIVESTRNKSDHNPITMTYIMNENLNTINSATALKPLRFGINWNNIQERLAFQKRVDIGIKKLETFAS